MEQTAELDELLPQLATAIRDGIGASWVRVRLREADGSWLDEPKASPARSRRTAPRASTWLAPASWSGESILVPSPAAMLQLILNCWPPWLLSHHGGRER